MSKCENCIHIDVCDKQKITNHTISKTVCKHYKDKSLFVELPCAVDTLVYVIEYCRCTQVENYYLKACHKKKQYNTPEVLAMVMKLQQGKMLVWGGLQNKWEYKDKAVICHKLRQKPFNLKMLTEVGKTVFLTKEEAKAKLKEIGK